MWRHEAARVNEEYHISRAGARLPLGITFGGQA